MPRSVERSSKSDKGYGLRRWVELSRTIHFSAQDIETRPEWIEERLAQAFKRVWLYDWYSRNHKRYAATELWIEGFVTKDDVSIDSIYWSKTHSAQEPAGAFFAAAVKEIAAKIAQRRYQDWYIHIIGLSMWRARVKRGE